MRGAGYLHGYFRLAGGFPAVEEGVGWGVGGGGEGGGGVARDVFVACEGGVGALGGYFS